MADGITRFVSSFIQFMLDQPDQTRWDNIMGVKRIRVIADARWVAHDDEKVADAQGVRRQQVALDAQ